MKNTKATDILGDDLPKTIHEELAEKTAKTRLPKVGDIVIFHARGEELEERAAIVNKIHVNTNSVDVNVFMNGFMDFQTKVALCSDPKNPAVGTYKWPAKN